MIGALFHKCSSQSHHGEKDEMEGKKSKVLWLKGSVKIQNDDGEGCFLEIVIIIFVVVYL